MKKLIFIILSVTIVSIQCESYKWRNQKKYSHIKEWAHKDASKCFFFSTFKVLIFNILLIEELNSKISKNKANKKAYR